MGKPLFQAAEILDMAIEIERQGLAFYSGCAAARATESVATVFEYAAEEERRHIETFSKMKRDLAEYTIPESYPGETRSYVRGFVGTRVFQSVDEATCSAEEMADELEAVEKAVELEHGAISFYTGAKELVRESEREIIDEIIAEEHQHIRNLLRLKHDLTAGSDEEPQDEPHSEV